MDGWSNQDPPHYDIHPVYTREKREGQNLIRGKSSAQKGEEGDKVVPPPKGSVLTSEKCSNVEANPCSSPLEETNARVQRRCVP